jgi:hypothetical protein
MPEYMVRKSTWNDEEQDYNFIDDIWSAQTLREARATIRSDARASGHKARQPHGCNCDDGWADDGPREIHCAGEKVKTKYGTEHRIVYTIWNCKG